MKLKEINLYKVDTIFLVIGPILFLAFLPGALDNASSGSIASAITGIILLSIPLSMVSIGFFYRIIEKRASRLLYLLELVSDVNIGELVRSTSLSPKQIKKILASIKKMGYGYYIWDEQLYRVYDRRLLDQFIYVEACPSCGSKMGTKYSLILQKIPECDYCKNPLPIKYWNELKLKTLDSISKNNLEAYKIESQKTEKLNKPLLIFLFLFFWPLGVYYLLKYKDI